jgi:15-cis-phytoene synthase
LSAQVSKITTRTYSTSFSLGIYFLYGRLRPAIYAIYGFVRLADEIVDSFEGYDKRALLKKLWADTYEALENRISVNPILNSFQQTVYDFSINPDLIETFLQSMEMDLEKISYDDNQYRQYIYGSAEVVGLMCLHVFTERDAALFEQLKPYATRLGAAFQKVNFLRDLKDDYQVLGRVYFPHVNMSQFNTKVKEQIESEIEEDFKLALEGIRQLPPGAKGGVYLAYVYYRSLFQKIKKLPAERILVERIRINNGRKLQLMVNSLLQSKMKMV